MSSGFNNGFLAGDVTANGPVCGPTSAPGALQGTSPGTAGQLFTSNGAGALPSMQTASGGGGGYPSELRNFFFYDDCLYPVGSSTDRQLEGNGTVANVTSTGNHPGIWSLTVDSDVRGDQGNASRFATNQGGEITFIAWVTFNGTIPTAAADEVFVGMGDSITIPTGNDQIGFLFDPTDNATNWNIVTDNAGTGTTTDSGVAMANGGTWQELKFVINAAGSSVEYFIDGSSVGTITTNIPTVVIYPVKIVVDSLSSTFLYLDAVQVQITYASGDRS